MKILDKIYNIISAPANITNWLIDLYARNKLQREIYLNNLSHMPAAWIDRMYLKPRRTLFDTIKFAIVPRVIFAAVFVPLLALNVATNLVSSIVNLLFFKTKAAAQNYDNMKKNLYGLALSPIGLVYPRNYTLLFLPPRIFKTNQVRAGGNKFMHDMANAENIKTPKSIAEVRSIVRYAQATGKKISVRGAGFSQGQQFLPLSADDIVIDMSQMATEGPFSQNDLYKIEDNLEAALLDHTAAPDYTVTVGAGVTWGMLEKRIAGLGAAVEVRQASNVFSIGGSISANVHGWAHKTGCIRNTIVSITIVNATGEIEEVTPEDELFNYIVGGYGQFGIIVQVKLRLVENVALLERGEEIDPQDYHRYFQSSDISDKQVPRPQHPSVKMHLYRLNLTSKRRPIRQYLRELLPWVKKTPIEGGPLRKGIATVYQEQPSLTPHIKRTDVTMEEANGTRGDRILTRMARVFTTMRRQYFNIETRRIKGNNPVLPLATQMQAKINGMFHASESQAEWLQEYFIPPEKLADFLEYLGKVLHDNKVVLLNASVRPVVADPDTMLSYAPEQRHAVVLCFTQDLDEDSIRRTRKWVHEVTHRVATMGGSYYLPYQPYADPTDFERSYPNYRRFLAKKAEVDPQGVFANQLNIDYLRGADLNRDHHIYARMLESNGEYLQHFRGFIENVLQDVDFDKFEALLKDILSYCYTEEDVYAELHARMHEIKPGAIQLMRRNLKALADLQADLAKQAAGLLALEHTVAMDDGSEQKIDPNVDGILEIGYPGRFIKPMRKQLRRKGIKVGGKHAAMQESTAITDIIESGWPRAHGKSHHLDYSDPACLAAIPDASHSVVTCFVGLHHFKPEDLASVIGHINRILKPGGSFLLVDHDVRDDKTLEMAHMAHSIFNAVKGVTPEEERTEVRNFQPISYWTEQLAAAGLEAVPSGEVITVRDGDPSMNTMVRFVKRPEPKPQLVAASEESSSLHSSAAASHDSPRPQAAVTRNRANVVVGSDVVSVESLDDTIATEEESLGSAASSTLRAELAALDDDLESGSSEAPAPAPHRRYWDSEYVHGSSVGDATMSSQSVTSSQGRAYSAPLAVRSRQARSSHSMPMLMSQRGSEAQGHTSATSAASNASRSSFFGDFVNRMFISLAGSEPTTSVANCNFRKALVTNNRTNRAVNYEISSRENDNIIGQLQFNAGNRHANWSLNDSLLTHSAEAEFIFRSSTAVAPDKPLRFTVDVDNVAPAQQVQALQILLSTFNELITASGVEHKLRLTAAGKAILDARPEMFPEYLVAKVTRKRSARRGA